MVSALEIIPHFAKKRLVELYDPAGIGELAGRGSGDMAISYLFVALCSRSMALTPPASQRPFGPKQENCSLG